MPWVVTTRVFLSSALAVFHSVFAGNVAYTTSRKLVVNKDCRNFRSCKQNVERSKLQIYWLAQGACLVGHDVHFQ